MKYFWFVFLTLGIWLAGFGVGINIAALRPNPEFVGSWWKIAFWCLFPILWAYIAYNEARKP